MKFYLDACGFIYLLDNNIFDELKREFPEIKEKKIKLCISPVVLEEFFFHFML